MQYVIRFNGHISWEGQSNGLPPVIYAYIVFEGSDGAEDKTAISNAIEVQTRAFISWQSMAVQREQGKILDIRAAGNNRMLVPFRWITHIDVDVLPMTGELSEADESGVERLKDGTEPQKQ